MRTVGYANLIGQKEADCSKKMDSSKRRQGGAGLANLPRCLAGHGGPSRAAHEARRMAPQMQLRSERAVRGAIDSHPLRAIPRGAEVRPAALRFPGFAEHAVPHRSCSQPRALKFQREFESRTTMSGRITRSAAARRAAAAAAAAGAGRLRRRAPIELQGAQSLSQLVQPSGLQAGSPASSGPAAGHPPVHQVRVRRISRTGVQAPGFRVCWIFVRKNLVRTSLERARQYQEVHLSTLRSSSSR